CAMCHQVRSVARVADYPDKHSTLVPAHQEITHKRGSPVAVYSALCFLLFLQQATAHSASLKRQDAQYLKHASLRQDAVSATHGCDSGGWRSSRIGNAPAALCSAHSVLLP